MLKQKKNLFARLYEALVPSSADKMKRTYAAARSNRLNVGWTTNPTGANHEHRVSLATLIARSRQAARDDLHIVNYLRLMRSNVIGQKGIQLQSRARMADGKTPNVKLNKRVEEAFWQWGHAETCTVSGKLDWKGVQDLAVTQGERDGAFLIQMIEADNEWGFALRTWDVTWLDFTYNENVPGKNRVIMSVEVDSNDKPVAYWMTMPSSEYTFADARHQQQTRQRIPAEQIIHGVDIFDDESQVHGVPGTAAALLPAKNAYSYCESVVMASRVAVNQFAVLINTMADENAGEWAGEVDGEGNPTHPFVDSAPLQITPLLPGWEMQQFKPEHPTQNHPAFKETLDMDVAVALGVPYFLLMGNWKAVNFSSGKGGLGEFRERCKSKQEFVAKTLCRRVFHAWLQAAMMRGKLKLTAKEYLEVQNPAWQPRGYDSLQPEKDTANNVEKLRNRLALPSQILGEEGQDYDDFLEKWDSDRKRAAVYGINIDELYAEPKQQLAAAPPEEDDDEGEETKKPPADTDERALLETLLMKADLGVPVSVLQKEMGYTNGAFSHE